MLPDTQFAGFTLFASQTFLLDHNTTMLSRTLSSARQLRLASSSLRHARAFSVSPIHRVQEISREAIDTPLSLWNFTEEENMLRETGQHSPLNDGSILSRV